MEKSVKKVLLVDDDRATNFFNERVVSKHTSFDKLATVQSGKAALAYLSDVGTQQVQKPDLIFLDINMPAMNGWEFLIEFSKLDKQTTAGIKVIMLSTSSNPDDIQQSKQNRSVNDFVSKPLSLSILDNVFQKHFE